MITEISFFLHFPWLINKTSKSKSIAKQKVNNHIENGKEIGIGKMKRK